jgi:hypothetical protein
MVDWDRVAQLRSKGWEWDEIAEDPKVGFTADAGSGDPGRALRVLYHRRRGKDGPNDPPGKKGSRSLETVESKWNLLRVGYVLVPVVAVWFVVAFLAPSPVGLILPAIPYIALILAGVALLLIYAILKSEKRWTKVYRNTVIAGVVLGLVFTGVVGLTGSLVFGCPYLLPSTSGSNPGGAPGWAHYGNSAWHDSGKTVVFFYGATWCPYCSAGSWTIWKALQQYGVVTPNPPLTGYSSLSDVYAGTPEVYLASTGVTSNNISFQVSEDTSGVDGTFPGTSNCYQAAYVSSYSGSAIPFLVVNGQWIHAGTPIINPSYLTPWNSANSSNSGGASTVYSQVQAQNGSAWNILSTQTHWTMAFIAVSCGATNSAGVTWLGTNYKWTPATVQAVTNDVAAIES